MIHNGGNKLFKTGITNNILVNIYNLAFSSLSVWILIILLMFHFDGAILLIFQSKVQFCSAF